MNYYNSIPNKYNRFILLILMVSPFIGYVLSVSVDVDFNKFFTLLTFIGVILILFFSSKNNPIKFPKYLFFYGLFIFYVYYSTFFQLDKKFKIIYIVHYFIGGFNILFIIENLSINKKHYTFLFNLSKKVLIVAVLVIFIQQIYSANFFVRTDSIKVVTAGNRTRLYSIYTWTNAMSGVGLSFVPILLILLENLDKKKKSKLVIIWILTGIVFALLTRYRWVIVNTLLVFFVLLITERNKMQKISKYIIILPLILFLSYNVLNFAGINVKGIVEDRLLEKGKKKSHLSATTRILAFEVFNNLYWKNAVFGVGDMKYGIASGDKGRHNYELSKALGGSSSQIHVGYLSLFYLYGLIGGVLFLLFLFYCLKMLYKTAKRTKRWSPFFGLICFLLANFTLVNYSMLELGLIFSLVSSKYFTEQQNFHLKNNMSYYE